MGNIQPKPEQTPQNILARNFNVFSLLQFASPTILMMIFMGLYTIVDTIFVARFVNTYALSATIEGESTLCFHPLNYQ